MNEPVDLHSRSVLAGYDPTVLRTAKVLVVGLGALGQNIVQDLALAGVGRLLLVDFDEFEEHNATRSPYYPTGAEAARLGHGKAPVVAHRAAQASTASDPEVYYSACLIQQLGDGAVTWADVVVAVDSMTARAWLAERCRLLSRPMVEGGFEGPHFSLAAFPASAGAVCYRCDRPDQGSAVSCTAYARAAQAAHVVPAIQTTAAVLAAYQAEQVIQLLHGKLDLLGRRVYGNVRRPGRMVEALLSADDRCPGVHDPEPVLGTVRGLPGEPTMQDLLAAVAAQFGGAWIELAEAVIPNMSCTRCLAPCVVRAAHSSWQARPYCEECGGPWKRTDSYAPDSRTQLRTADRLEDDLACTLLRDIGLRAGASVSVLLDDGRSGLLRMPGDVLGCVSRAVPCHCQAETRRSEVNVPESSLHGT